MKVTADVEPADQQLFLRAAGVHCMQGYRFGRPMPAAQIAERLAAPASFKPEDETAALASWPEASRAPYSPGRRYDMAILPMAF